VRAKILDVRFGTTKEALQEAATVLREGGLVVFPTETVYGLGANALDGKSVLRIFEAKGRPADNPLIVHVAEASGAEKVAFVPKLGHLLMERFWPGPLTLVMPACPVVPSSVTAGLSTVAVRMPAQPVALELIRLAGVPVAAPSANLSGRPSPTDARAVEEDLGDRVEMILDGGPTQVGVESTVLDITGERAVLLRPGGVPIEALEEFLGYRPLLPGTDGAAARRSPGTRYRHYAPRVPLFLREDESVWEKIEAWDPSKRAYVGIRVPGASFAFVRLFPDAESYARGLFSALRELERSGACVIVADWPAEARVGLALRDRLRRASGGSWMPE
jgi:L-threonylcarbamoyladenylate synthase